MRIISDFGWFMIAIMVMFICMTIAEVKGTPRTPETPEQTYQRLYSSCVRTTATINIEQCNKILKPTNETP